MTTTVPAPQVTLIRAVFDAIDSMRAQSAAQLLHDDVTFVFGNGPAVHGRPDVEQAMVDFLAALGGIRHELTGLWQASDDPDTVIAQMTVHYTRQDGSHIHLPCCNVFRVRAGLVADYRIYMDVNPVFAAAA